MVKVRFTDNKRCGYYSDKDIIFIRRTLFKEPEEKIKKVLEHEITHSLLKKTWLNILFEYRTLFIGLVVIAITYWYYYQTDYALCMANLQNLTRIIGISNYNLTHYKMDLNNTFQQINVSDIP